MTNHFGTGDHIVLNFVHVTVYATNVHQIS